MKSKEELNKATLKRLKPLSKKSVSEWADEYRQLTVGVSAEPGRWKTSRVPYAKEIMDAFSEVKVKRVTVKSAAQVSKTEIILNVIGRYAHLDPCPILLIEPTEELMKDVSKSRIATMIRDCKVLKPLFYELKEAKSRNSKQTILTKIFPGGRLVMCGANSPTNLASRSIRILLCDEVDRFPATAGSEGDPIEIAAKRTTTYWDAKIGLFSTPTIKGESRIELEYEEGSQEEWSHQCPNCGEYEVPNHENMNVEYEVKKNERGRKIVTIYSVKWRCPQCGLEFSEEEIKRSKQKYEVKNEEGLKKGHRSFFISGFSSPWLSWKQIYEEYYRAIGQPKLEQVVWNTRFGRSYELGEVEAESAKLFAKQEEYEGEVPNEVMVLTAAVDVQDNRLECEVCGWSQSEECYGIAIYKIIGVPNKQKTWLMLDAILDKEYEKANGQKLKIIRTMIDSGGHFTSNVYEYCRENKSKQRIAIKGYGGYGATLMHKTTILKKYGIVLMIIGVNEGKDEVMARLQLTEGQIFHFPKKRGYDDNYYKQLTSEHKVQRMSQGMIRSIWEPITKKMRNEALDLRVYNLACFESIKGLINQQPHKKKMKAVKMDVY